MASEGTIAAAYLDGRRAAEKNESLDANPHYGRPDATTPEEEYDAWRSGWLDRTNQLKKMR